MMNNTIILIMIFSVSIIWGQGKTVVLPEKTPFTLNAAVLRSIEPEKPENVPVSQKSYSLQDKRRIKKKIRVAKSLSIPFLILGYTCIGAGFITNLTGYIVDEPIVDITAISTMGGGVVLVIPGHIFLKRKRRLEKELKEM